MTLYVFQCCHSIRITHQKENKLTLCIKPAAIANTRKCICYNKNGYVYN